MSRSDEIINARRLAFGAKSELMAISPMKHKWARDTWKAMLANNWTMNEVDLTSDGTCYRTMLTDGQRYAFDSALAFVSNLDGIQLHNLTNNISKCITSPEVEMLITRQAYEEALHVDSYSQIVESVSTDPMAVYMRFEQDGMLAAKNEYIMRQSAILGEHPCHENFARAIVSNIALEGIFFYSGFLNFYLLGRGGKMIGASDAVKFINRDEITHLHLFANMHRTHLVEEPWVYDESFYRDAETILRDAVEYEIRWGKYIIRYGVPGASNTLISEYMMHLGNERAALLGLQPLYPGVKNPYGWIEQFSNPDKKREKNFFESKVVDYSVGTLSDWE